MLTDPAPYSDPDNGKKPAYKWKDSHPIPKYRINDPHKAHPNQQSEALKQGRKRELNMIELFVRALEEMDARGLGEDLGLPLEARHNGDPPKYSKHDPLNGKKPSYKRKDPYPIPKYRINDPYKARPEQQSKASKQGRKRELDIEVLGRDIFDWDDLE